MSDPGPSSVAQASPPRVRVGVVQLAMRPLSDQGEFFEQASFFISSIASYGADFVCFPEYVNAPLMARDNELGARGAIRSLAKETAEMVDFFLQQAVTHRINIITGSMPVLEEGFLRNVAYLCHRDGSVSRQDKIQVTPNEVNEWGMVGGDRVRVFDTDAGKIGILICYDVEFPELGRFLAGEGLQILFVPFCTDTASGFHRVSFCARARAIENECYVVTAGSVGNLNGVANVDFHYARSAVFSPSDFGFPENGIVTEAPANLETALIADLDLSALARLHDHGSVRNLRQRRTDLYGVEWKP